MLRPFKIALVAVFLGLSLVPVLVTAAPVLGEDADALHKDLDAAAQAYARLEDQLAANEQRRIRLESDLSEADRIIASKAVQIRKRAGYMYKQGGGSDFLNDLLMSPNFGVFLRRLLFVEVLDKKDVRLVEGLGVTKARADQLKEQLAAGRSADRVVADRMRDKQVELASKFKGAQAAFKVRSFGKFPSFTMVLDPSAFTNTWNAPRSGGRRHKGTDVLAACGAPVVAVTDGTITELPQGGIGGIMMFLKADNGDVFFYAHLRKYAAGVQVGQRVKTGQLVGYNGNSGNARGGPCHVHFEWHPAGGRPVNPYPLLASVR